MCFSARHGSAHGRALTASGEVYVVQQQYSRHVCSCGSSCSLKTARATIDSIYSRLNAVLAEIFPELTFFDISDFDDFAAAMRSALVVDSPAMVSVECDFARNPDFSNISHLAVGWKHCCSRESNSEEKPNQCSCQLLTLSPRKSTRSPASIPTPLKRALRSLCR